jgi:hypothetical protein
MAAGGHSSLSLSIDNGDWHMTWSSNGRRMDVKMHGAVTFTDDLTDVQTMSDGAFLTIRDWSNVIPHTVEITSSGGRVSHAYFVGGLSRPWDDEARRWLAAEVPLLVRRAGIGAESRTKSILEKKGVSGVLEEVRLLEGDYVRRLYLQALVNNARLDATTVLPVLRVVSERMTSDYDRAEILKLIATRVTLDEGSARVYVEALTSMKSDYDRRRALSAVLATRPLAPGVADLAMSATSNMHSDYDRRQVLHAALGAGASVDHAQPLVAALDTMRSAYDKREVLLEMIDTRSLGADAKTAVLNAAAGVNSDYDRRVVLAAFTKAYTVDQTTRDAYFAAVKSMHSDYDRAEVLLALANARAVDASLRPAFVAAAESIKSTYDQNRVLAALVRAERH